MFDLRLVAFFVCLVLPAGVISMEKEPGPTLKRYQEQALLHIKEKGPVGDSARAFLPYVNQAIEALQGETLKVPADQRKNTDTHIFKNSPTSQFKTAKSLMESEAFIKVHQTFEAARANPDAAKAIQSTEAKASSSGRSRGALPTTVRPQQPKRQSTKDLFPKGTDP